MRGQYWDNYSQIQNNWTNKKIITNVFLSFGLQSIGWILASILLALPVHFLLKDVLAANISLFVFGVLSFILLLIKAANKYAEAKYFELNPPSRGKTTYFMIVDGLLLMTFSAAIMMIASYELILIALAFTVLIVIGMILIGWLANKKTFNILVITGTFIGIITVIGLVILLIFYFFGIFSLRSGLPETIPHYLYIIISSLMLVSIAIGIAIKVYMLRKVSFQTLNDDKIIKNSIYYQGYQLFSMFVGFIIVLILILKNIRK